MTLDPDQEPAGGGRDGASAVTEAVLGALEEGVLVCGADRSVLACNPRAEELLGLTAAQVAGTEPLPDGWHALREDGSTWAPRDYPLRVALRTGRPEERRIMGIRRPDGSIRWLSATARPLRRDGDERPYAVVCSFLDVTETRAGPAPAELAARLADAQALARVGSYEWDLRTGRINASDELFRVYGREPGEDPSLERFEELVHPEDRERVRRSLERVLAEGGTTEDEYRIVVDGEERVIHGRGETVPGPDGRPAVLRGTAQDVTAQRRAEQALRTAQERFRAAFESSPIGMAITDLDGRFVDVNPALAALTGYPPEQLRQMTAAALTHPDDAPAEAEQLRALVARQEGSTAFERRLVTAGGTTLWTAVHATVLHGPDGRPSALLRQVQDVSDRKRFERRLRHLADHDALTGLLNRRAFAEELERRLEHAERYGWEGALLVIDVDRFKLVNDLLGHVAGDEVLVAVADRLRSRLRDTDVLARLGGDEFAALLPQAGPDEAQAVADDLLGELREVQVVLGGRPRRITASIGVALIDGSTLSGEELLVNADLAMYQAKEAGRDRLAVHRPRDAGARLRPRAAWAERIEEALRSDGFVLHAQPILDLRSGATSGHELLIRMRTPDGELVPPGTFLYVAERFDLIAGIDRWVVERAGRLLSGHPDVALHVNLSPRTLSDEGFAGAVDAALEQAGAEPSRLTFELSESAAVANINLARAFAERIRGRGCRLALDDFGASFGSFYYLRHLPFDALKIDGELVRGCAENRSDQLVVRAVVEIARGLGAETIAECTEDAQTLQLMRALGVDHAQGHHVGWPVDVAEALGGGA